MGGGCRLVTNGQLVRGTCAGLTNEHPEQHLFSCPDPKLSVTWDSIPRKKLGHVATLAVCQFKDIRTRFSLLEVRKWEAGFSCRFCHELVWSVRQSTLPLRLFSHLEKANKPRSVVLKVWP